MAKHLIGNGYPVTVTDISPEQTKKAAAGVPVRTGQGTDPN